MIDIGLHLLRSKRPLRAGFTRPASKAFINGFLNATLAIGFENFLDSVACGTNGQPPRFLDVAYSASALFGKKLDIHSVVRGCHELFKKLGDSIKHKNGRILAAIVDSFFFGWIGQIFSRTMARQKSFFLIATHIRYKMFNLRWPRFVRQISCKLRESLAAWLTDLHTQCV